LQEIATTQRPDDAEAAMKFLERTGFAEVWPVLDAGLVKFAEGKPRVLLDETNTYYDHWLDSVERLLKDSSRYLIFDDASTFVTKSLDVEADVRVREGLNRRSTRASLGTGLIARLPAFPSAGFDELMDLRQDLHAPLTRYRKAVSKMTEALTVSSIDPGFDGEIDEMWTLEVEPLLVELEESFTEHGLPREIARAFRIDIKSLVGAGSAIWIGLQNHFNVDQWIAQGTLAAGGIALVQALVEGSKVRSNARRDLNKREFFYLYEVNRRLLKS
jgi:hypothetical protein